MNFHDWLNQLQFVMETKQDNNVTGYIGVVYAKTETELLGTIKLGALCYQN